MKNNKIVLSLLGLSLTGMASVDTAKVAKAEAKVADKAVVKAASSDLKIRVVDAFEVMQKSLLGAEITKELSDTNQKWAAEITQRGKELEQDLLAFDSKKVTMSESAREKEERRLAKAKRDYQVSIEEKNQEFQMMQAKSSERMLKEVRDNSTIVARAENIDVIVDRTTGQILYSSESANVTGKLVDSMNAKFVANQKATATPMLADNKKAGAQATAAA